MIVDSFSDYEEVAWTYSTGKTYEDRHLDEYKVIRCQSTNTMPEEDYQELEQWI
jgi:hypothetical protein